MLLVADCQRISEKLLGDPAAVWEMLESQFWSAWR
jgi:hypothetical protein